MIERIFNYNITPNTIGKVFINSEKPYLFEEDFFLKKGNLGVNEEYFKTYHYDELTEDFKKVLLGLGVTISPGQKYLMAYLY